jgi:hypothetical protein
LEHHPLEELTSMKRTIYHALSRFAAALAIASALVSPASASSRTVFINSAVEAAGDLVSLPLHRGTSKGEWVYYVILDTSSGSMADALGVNRSQKLANAANTQAVQKVSVGANGVIDFPGTVDFTPARTVTGTLGSGFPPVDPTRPGAVADAQYSPLIQLPDGTIVNAPQLANSSGRADKVVSIDLMHMRVTYKETNGFQGGRAVKYVSTDASDPVAAALEDVTYVERLNNAPRLDDDSTGSSRTSLAAFVNGQAGAFNPNRQGLNSAIRDGLDPLNVLRWNPSQGRYSPLWDVHLARWSDAAVKAGINTRQSDWGAVKGLADHGLVTAPDGTAFAASGFIVNCPIVSGG